MDWTTGQLWLHSWQGTGIYHFPKNAQTSSGIHLVGRGRPDHDQQHCYHHAPTVKPEAATAVVELLMMGVRMPETC